LIQSIYLRNFESHRSTKLQFGPGINIISGISNHGKSSIIRGLHWIRRNKPSGNSMVSFWNRDKKDSPIKPTFVQITLSNGNEIKRERSSGFNGYVINDSKLEAIGQGVPTEIETAFPIDDVNIQYQFDQPFLLSDSSADVARFFNKTIRLDLIDKVQSKAEALRRKTNQEITSSEELSKSLHNQIQTFDWLDIADSIVSKIESVENRLSKTQVVQNGLVKLLESFETANATKIKQESIAAYISNIEAIDLLIASISDQPKLLNALSQSNINVIKLQKEIKKLDSVSADSIVLEIDSIQARMNSFSDKKKKLISIFTEYQNELTIIQESEEEIVELKHLLPSICPACGNSIEEME